MRLSACICADCVISFSRKQNYFPYVSRKGAIATLIEKRRSKLSYCRGMQVLLLVLIWEELREVLGAVPLKHQLPLSLPLSAEMSHPRKCQLSALRSRFCFSRVREMVLTYSRADCANLNPDSRHFRVRIAACALHRYPTAGFGCWKYKSRQRERIREKARSTVVGFSMLIPHMLLENNSANSK